MARKVEAKINASQSDAFNTIMRPVKPEQEKPAEQEKEPEQEKAPEPDVKEIHRVYRDFETGLYAVAATHDTRIGVVIPEVVAKALDREIREKHPEFRGKGLRTKYLIDMILRDLRADGWEVGE